MFNYNLSLQITNEELRQYFLYLKNEKKYARATQTINVKVFKSPVCKKEMVVLIVIPRPSRRFNKAPPQMNGSFDNLSFNRCA